MIINLIAPITDKTSYGLVTLNIAKSLDKLGHDVILQPIPGTTPQKIPELDKFLNRSVNTNAPTIIVWHHYELKKFRSEFFKGPIIGFPIFECDRFNEHEIDNLNSMDYLFVTCKWYKGILDIYTKTRSFIVNLGVDKQIFTYFKNNETSSLFPTTKFLHIGKWEIRKGIDFIIDSFKQAFKNNERYILTLCCNNWFIGEYENKVWADHFIKNLGKEHVNIIPRLETQHDVCKLMLEHDIGIFPSRAEGWNLELLEMMSLGKECICTDFSAHTEFCNSNNSNLISVDDYELAYDGKWFFGQCNWAKLGNNQLNQMVDYLKNLHSLKQKNGVQYRSEEISKSVSHLTWENTANDIIKHIMEINNAKINN